jgi:hypothetical protein
MVPSDAPRSPIELVKSQVIDDSREPTGRGASHLLFAHPLTARWPLTCAESQISGM